MKNITVTPREIDKTSPQYYWGKIRSYCHTYGINRKELATVTNLSEATISNYNSDPINLSFSTVNKFCRAYHIDSLTVLENF